MKSINLFIVILIATALFACAKKDNSSLPDIKNWALLKKHKVTKDDPLYEAFGAVVYEVYRAPVEINDKGTEPGSSLHSAYAILVYANDNKEEKPWLIGFLRKSGDDARTAKWQLSAYDGKQQPLPESQISTCRQCHTAEDDRIVLGHY